jgi:hypothetical protein
MGGAESQIWEHPGYPPAGNAGQGGSSGDWVAMYKSTPILFPLPLSCTELGTANVSRDLSSVAGEQEIPSKQFRSKYAALICVLCASQEAQSRAQQTLATSQLEVVEGRERLLEEQRRHLERKHRQLAEDLSERQHRLNREWAVADMAGRRDPELERERAAMQAEWRVIEEEWNALEERKGHLWAVSPPPPPPPHTHTPSHA